MVHSPTSLAAHVREYTDPEKAGNRSRVYTWRKDLAALMCQQCSDAKGGPVLLEASGCTKKKCFVAEQSRTEMKARAAELQQEEGALHARQREHGEGQEGEVAGDEMCDLTGVQPEVQQRRFVTTSVTREVRAVHGLEVGKGKQKDKEVMWFYVPENKHDKNNTKRKGWICTRKKGPRDATTSGRWLWCRKLWRLRSRTLPDTRHSLSTARTSYTRRRGM
jgi:hypothetical protein